jgi:proline iminopeptidase
MVVTDDGCRLWTARSGTGDPLVLCHGGPGFWDTFGDLAALLGDVAAVHRWDQRGCGRSERRGPYTVARSLADLDAVRRHHGLARTALLGHSWGAELALRYALAHPGRVTRLVYVSGVGADPEATWHGDFERNLVERLGDLARWRLLRRRSPRSPGEERELAVLRLSADFADRDRALELAERVTTPFLGADAECNRALNADRRRTVENGELLRASQALQVPVLLVDGALDLRPRRAVDSLERALPAARRVVLDGAHLPWVEAPAAFRAAVTGFLSSGDLNSGRGSRFGVS